MNLKVEVVEALAESLKDLPELDQVEQEVTKPEAVRMLLPRIKELRSKGYSLERIAEKLTEGGLPITAVTLRSYLARSGGRRKGSSKRKAKAPGKAEGAHAPEAKQPKGTP